MKRILLLAAFFFSIGSGFAQSLSSGFYRIQNKCTGRYMMIRDNQGSLNLSQSDADLKALTTILGVDNAISNPGTVLYIQQVSGEYNVEAQGTDIYSVITYYLRLSLTEGGDSWYAYQKKSGVTKYICDQYDATEFGQTYSKVYTGGKDEDASEWYITPIDASTDVYAAVKPTVKVDEKYYAPYYAGYAFNLVSDGMKAYYIDLVQGEYCRLVEIKGTVPKATPVIIECSSDDVSKNRIQPVVSTTAGLMGNQLTGVYFDINSGTHRNFVTYDANTMRILGLTDDGKLGLVTDSSLSHVPANTFYLTVAPETAASLEAVEEIPTKEIVLGDADGNGEISVSDITMVASMIIEGIKDSSANPAADVNKDGVISVSDISALAAMILEQSGGN